jgi:hypothetical protein
MTEGRLKQVTDLHDSCYTEYLFYFITPGGCWFHRSRDHDYYRRQGTVFGMNGRLILQRMCNADLDGQSPHLLGNYLLGPETG